MLSVRLGTQNAVRLSYVVSNMRNEMKCCLSVSGRRTQSVSVIRGFQYEEWNEMSNRLSQTWFPIWGMKWNVVCPSVIRGFQYEEWNEMLSVCLSHTWFPIWGMKWNVVCLSVIRCFQYEEWNVCPSVIRGFQYEEWNEMLSVCLSHTWCPIWGMKWKVVYPSVIRGFQYEEWNQMSVRLSQK